jgi:hypothetical protein
MTKNTGVGAPRAAARTPAPGSGTQPRRSARPVAVQGIPGRTGQPRDGQPGHARSPQKNPPIYRQSQRHVERQRADGGSGPTIGQPVTVTGKYSRTFPRS